MNSNANPDPDAAKGAVEPSRPEDDADGNMAQLSEQLDHRFQDSLNKSSDSGMSNTGQTPEFSMESQGENKLKHDTADPTHHLGVEEATEEVDADSREQEPGTTQRQNQGGQEEDPLAA